MSKAFKKVGFRVVGVGEDGSVESEHCYTLAGKSEARSHYRAILATRKYPACIFEGVFRSDDGRTIHHGPVDGHTSGMGGNFNSIIAYYDANRSRYDLDAANT